MKIKLSNLPNNYEIAKSRFTLEQIRAKLSPIVTSEIKIDSRQAALIELIFTLANEIHELKQEIETLKK